jgi:hypothetical protein
MSRSGALEARLETQTQADPWTPPGWPPGAHRQPSGGFERVAELGERAGATHRKKNRCSKPRDARLRARRAVDEFVVVHPLLLRLSRRRGNGLSASGGLGHGGWREGPRPALDGVLRASRGCQRCRDLRLALPASTSAGKAFHGMLGRRSGLSRRRGEGSTLECQIQAATTKLERDLEAATDPHNLCGDIGRARAAPRGGDRRPWRGPP